MPLLTPVDASPEPSPPEECLPSEIVDAVAVAKVVAAASLIWQGHTTFTASQRTLRPPKVVSKNEPSEEAPLPQYPGNLTTEEGAKELAKRPIPIDVLKDTVGKWNKGSTFVAVWAQHGDPFVYKHHGTVQTRHRDGTFTVKYDEIPQSVKIPPPPSHRVDYFGLDAVDVKVKPLNPRSVAQVVE